MRRRRILLTVLVLVCAGLLGGWLWLRLLPQQAADVLGQWGLDASRARDLVTRFGGALSDRDEEVLVLSGSIEADPVSVVSEFTGRIARLPVQEGDEVAEGQTLVELDTSLLLAQMSEAEAALGATQAQLAVAEAGAHPAEVLTAQAALQRAIASRDAAHTAWDDAQAILDNPQALDAQIIQAQVAVDMGSASIEQAQSQLAQAQVQRDQYNRYGSAQDKSLYQVYDYQVQAAQAALDAARAREKEAQDTLETLKAIRDNPLATLSQVHLAEGQYEVADAGVAVAEAKLAELQSGPAPEEIAVARAQVEKAQAAADALQVQIGKMTLHAPISGLVSSRPAHAGETALAGVTLLTVADLDEVQLVVYVAEDKLGRVFLGQQIPVRASAFPGQEFSGVVVHIAQQAEFTPKNVQTDQERASLVFAVKLRIKNPDHRLRPGMPADVTLGSE